MGKLECTRCGGVIDKPTFKEAQESLDHGVGLTRNRPCPNDGSNLLLWNGVPVDPKNPPTVNPNAGAIQTNTSSWPDNTGGSHSTVFTHTMTSSTTSSPPPKPKHTKTTKKTKK